MMKTVINIFFLEIKKSRKKKRLDFSGISHMRIYFLILPLIWLPFLLHCFSLKKLSAICKSVALLKSNRYNPDLLYRYHTTVVEPNYVKSSIKNKILEITKSPLFKFIKDDSKEELRLISKRGKKPNSKNLRKFQNHNNIHHVTAIGRSLLEMQPNNDILNVCFK